MSNRLFEIASAIALVSVAVVSALAQSQSKSAAPSAALFAKEGAGKAAASRTPEGVPDLSGFYTTSTTVPFERPKDLGAKEFFTPEEAAAYAKRSLAAKAPTGPGTYADVHYDMAQFGLEKDQNKVSTSIRTSIVTGPEGRVPPVLPAARQRQAAKQAVNRGHEFDGPENRGLAEQCIYWNGAPPMTAGGYNSNIQISQGKGYVAITSEMIHETRIIPTDNSAHLPATVKMMIGDGRGHWDGDTLVIDTTNFSDRSSFRGSDENLHVVERLSRADAGTLKYEFTVTDPTVWEKSWSGEMPIAKIDGPLFEYACTEGNYGMRNNLSGARADEAKGIKPNGRAALGE
ncbi:MAG TPA: hypothetical protein VG297_04385 [Bryobacteraceae bacterium]|jgi:hypothetical protein|nr:hypothetical protein [Bryobacteraceae bacterium]